MGHNTRELKASPLEKKTPKPRDVIYDPQGQWKYPGQVTKIPGGDITMQGVNYPVLGVDDMGNQQMMMPGGQYTFPGNSVTEYPQMQAMYGGDPSIPDLTQQKRGGLVRGRPRGYTSQNIKTSINTVMQRNEKLFGPAGKHFYNPQAMANLKKNGGEAFPQQPTANEFFQKGWNPQGPVGFYKQGGVSTNELAFPQQPTADQFFSRGFVPQGPVGFYAFGGVQPFPQAPPMDVMFSGAQWSPQYGYGGGLPGGSNEMPCLECGGYMQDGGMPTGMMMMDNMEEFKSGGSDWIQKATKGMRKDHPCTGAKFGSSTCPPGSKRYNLAKTFRAMAKKQFGGDADADDMGGVSDFDQDDYPAMIANTFAGHLKSNTQKSIADEAAQNMAMQQDAMMQYGGGMNMMDYGYNPNMNNAQIFQQKSDFMDQKQKQAGQRFMNATQQLAGTANPYMDWDMPKAQTGYVTGVTGNKRYRLNEQTGQVEAYEQNDPGFDIQHQSGYNVPGYSIDPRTLIDSNGVQTRPIRPTNYPPNYQGEYRTDQWNTQQQGTQGSRAIPYNYNPYMQWKQSGQNLAPVGQSYLQSYEATKRLFGPGARKVKMTFRTYYDPQTGQTHQVPDQGQDQHPMQQPGWNPTQGKKQGHINSYAEDVAALQQQAGDMPSSGVMPRKDFTQKHGRNWFGNDSPDIKTTAEEIRAIKREQNNPFRRKNDTSAVDTAPAQTSKSMRPVDNYDPTAADFDAQGNWIGSNKQKGGPIDMNRPEVTLSPQDSIYFTKELAKPMYDPNKYSYRSVDNSQKGTKRHPVDDQVFKTNKATGKEIPVPPAMWNPGVMKEIIRRQQVAAGQAPTYQPLFWPQPGNPPLATQAYGGDIPMAQFGYNAYGQPDAQFQGPLSAQFVDASTQGQAGQTGQSYYDTTVTGKRKMGLDGESSANWLLAGISGATALANSGENRKTKEEMQRKSLADNQFYSMDRPDQGKWNPTGMSAGMFDPNNMGVIQQPGQNYAMEGPRFQEGGEYDLTPEEIDNIMRNGGTVTYLD